MKNDGILIFNLMINIFKKIQKLCFCLLNFKIKNPILLYWEESKIGVKASKRKETLI